MAPHSQLWKGSCADLVNAAKQRKAMGSMAAVECMTTDWASMAWMDRVPMAFCMNSMAARKPMPPTMFIHKARVALRLASRVPSWLMRKKEHRVVISQKKNTHVRLSQRTRPFIAPRNSSRKKKKRDCLDLARRR